MKTRFSILFIAILGFVWAGCEKGDNYSNGDTAAAEMSENETLAESLRANQAAFHAILEGLTDEQLAFQESEDRWSIAGVAEHITASADAMVGMVGGFLEGEAVAARPDSMMSDDDLYMMITNRETTFQAPPDFVPTGRYESMAACMEAFDSAQAGLIAVMSSEKDLRMHVGAHPAGFEMDSYQWVMFIMGHTERHMKQIQQVKDHADFPSA